MVPYFQFGYFKTDEYFFTQTARLKVGSVNVFNAAAQNIEAYNIPGRIGEYLPEDAEVTYPNEIREYITGVYFKNATQEEVQAGFADIRKYLMPFANKYTTLTDSYEPGYYRRAYFTGEFVPERLGARNNFRIPIRFSCDPRRFILPETSEELPAGTASTQVANTSEFPAHPILEVKGCGAAFNISFQHDGETVGEIQFKAFSSLVTVVVDCETTNVTRLNGSNANGWVNQITGSLTLNNGVTTIVKSNSDAAVVVRNRFWTR